MPGTGVSVGQVFQRPICALCHDTERCSSTEPVRRTRLVHLRWEWRALLHKGRVRSQRQAENCDVTMHQSQQLELLSHRKPTPTGELGTRPQRVYAFHILEDGMPAHMHADTHTCMRTSPFAVCFDLQCQIETRLSAGFISHLHHSPGLWIRQKDRVTFPLFFLLSPLSVVSF